MPRVWMGLGGGLNGPNDRLISYPGILRVEASKMEHQTSEQVPETLEMNGIVYHLARTFKGHGKDDKAHAHNEAYFIRRDGYLARVKKIGERYCVYKTYDPVRKVE
jgi:hypothetical protein